MTSAADRRHELRTQDRDQGGPAVDLDLVEDPTASPDDRAVDAELARLLAAELAAIEAPPMRVDVTSVIVAGGLQRRARMRHRRGWGAGALAAAAAVVVVAFVPVDLGALPSPFAPSERQHGPVSEGKPDAGAAGLRLREGVPNLPDAETQRLQALPEPSPHLTRGVNLAYMLLPVSDSAHEVDCDDAAVWLGTQVPALDGLDTTGLHVVCATSVAGELSGATNDGEVGDHVRLFRFFLPEGITLDDISYGNATAAGVAWVSVLTDVTAPPVEAQDAAADVASGSTTIRWADHLAQVTRTGAAGTQIYWLDPGSVRPMQITASIPAEPVTAARAALGFTNDASP